MRGKVGVNRMTRGNLLLKKPIIPIFHSSIIPEFSLGGL
jgi:hypothetical protein